jgi:hypothetical protein
MAPIPEQNVRVEARPPLFDRAFIISGPESNNRQNIQHSFHHGQIVITQFALLNNNINTLEMRAPISYQPMSQA